MKIIWDSKRNWTIVLLLIVIAVMVFAQRSNIADDFDGDDEEPPVQFDLADILARDTLKAITTNNSLSYFLYRGRPMGYEYELLQQYAEYLGVTLEMKVAESGEDLIELLNSGAGDVIANNMTVTNDSRERISFSDSYTFSKQVLVQRKPDKYWTMGKETLDEILVRNPIDLIGKKVDVQANSAFEMRLRNLSNEIGGDIVIVTHVTGASQEELIQMVADGKIDYTIADNNIALMNATYFKNIDVATDISFPQRVAWALRKNAPELLQSINEWLHEMERKGDYQVLYNKYFKNPKAFTIRQDSDFFSATGGMISPFDEIIKKYAAELNWDWRLLAAQIYTESKFQTDAQSWAGARGLMQIMPETASRFGDTTRINDPEYSIMMGVKYLKYLQKFWEEVPDSSQRVKFVLASYNVGEGHLLDACRLAQKYHKNPFRWDDSVDSFLVKKAYPAYYRDEVVYNGYCRGSEPFNYVRDVLTYYNHYSKLVNL